jgi:hypothetical protein
MGKGRRKSTDREDETYREKKRGQEWERAQKRTALRSRWK